MRWSPAHAGSSLSTARRIHGVLPGTLTALSAGDIDGLRAAIVAEHAGRLVAGLPEAADPTGPDPDPALVPDAEAAARELEDRVLPIALQQTPGRLRSACERAVAAIDPGAAAARAVAARRGRDVRCLALPDGQALIDARLDAAAAVSCQERIQALADRMRAAAGSGDPRLSGEWRAEAFANLLLGGATAAGLRDDDGPVSAPMAVPADAPVPPVPYQARVDVVIDLPTLLGLADNPAELAGHGPIPAETARTLMALAERETWRRMVTDPLTGHLLNYDPTTYRVPDPLRRFLHRRDGTCRFPGCRRRSSATGVDIDHATPWNGGGTTDRDNLGCLCRRHHQLKTHGGWRITGSGTDGTCTWTSPHGLTHHHRPPPVLDPSLMPNRGS